MPVLVYHIPPGLKRGNMNPRQVPASACLRQFYSQVVSVSSSFLARRIKSFTTSCTAMP